MKYYIIAGEASGDLYGAQLIDELKKADPEASFFCWGGDRMASKTGVTLRKHIRELAFMGFVEIVKHLRTIKRHFTFAKQDILSVAPDVVILIDYPGFNLRLAPFLKANGLTVFYYISPQIWAWKQKRVEKIRAYVDKMFVILPFEKSFYKTFNIDVVYEGHPLKDVIDTFKIKHCVDFEEFTKKHQLSGKPIIALLPGSRKQEIKRKLPVMLDAAQRFATTHQIVVAGAPAIERSFYEPFNVSQANVPVVFNQTYELLSLADAAFVTSGTATLETALFNCPQVVCYRSTQLSYWLAKQFIKVKYISLVNLIMDKPVVRELIQEQCNPQQAAEEMQRLLYDKTWRTAVKADYADLNNRLGKPGIAGRIAGKMVRMLQSAKILLLGMLFFITSSTLQAQYINVRIFSTTSVSSFIFSPLKGSYTLIASDTDTVATFTAKDVINFICRGDSISVKAIFQNYGVFSKLKLVAGDKYSYFRIKPVVPAGKEREYDDHLILSIEDNEFKIVNNVYLENYVAGVVESEGGPRAEIEYYKTQAIICRTYALQNLGRFYENGYDLCDNVNYQVYFGRSKRNYEIVEATYATKDLVLVDSSNQLITATFHANCGGETANSEDVWLKPLPYLRSVQDPYCTGFKHAHWKREINRGKWIKFLKAHGFQITPKTVLTMMMPHRKKYYSVGDHYLLATTIRSAWKLRSSFFDVIDTGHKIIIKGKGYGHGVGLCQEGAMKMSEKKFTYSEILHYYYTNVKIVNLFSLPQYIGLMSER